MAEYMLTQSGLIYDLESSQDVAELLPRLIFWTEDARKHGAMLAAASDMYKALKECVQFIEQQNIPEYKIGARLAEYKKLLLKAEGREV